MKTNIYFYSTCILGEIVSRNYNFILFAGAGIQLVSLAKYMSMAIIDSE